MKLYGEPKKKTAVCIAAGGMALVLLFCVQIRRDKERIREADVSDLTEETTLVFVIDEVTLGEYIRVEGYAYVAGESIHTVDQRVLLYDAQENRYYEIPTQLKAREELNQTDEDKKNYSGGGFLAKVKTAALKKDCSEYEICVAYRSDGHRMLAHSNRMLDGREAGEL